MLRVSETPPENQTRRLIKMTEPNGSVCRFDVILDEDYERIIQAMRIRGTMIEFVCDGSVYLTIVNTGKPEGIAMHYFTRFMFTTSVEFVIPANMFPKILNKTDGNLIGEFTTPTDVLEDPKKIGYMKEFVSICSRHVFQHCERKTNVAS